MERKIIMKEQQIKQNAEKYATKATESLVEKRPAYIRAYKAYIAGAQSMLPKIEELKKQLAECDKMYRELQQQSPWINAEVRLPKENQLVIIHTKCNNTYLIKYNAHTNQSMEGNFIFGSGYVDYWMPIPELPKGE